MKMVQRQTDTENKKTKYWKKTFPGTTLSTTNPSLQCLICGGQSSTDTGLLLVLCISCLNIIQPMLHTHSLIYH